VSLIQVAHYTFAVALECVRIIKYTETEMSLIRYKHFWDYGHEFYTQVMNIKNFSLLSLSLVFSSYFDWRLNLSVCVSAFTPTHLFGIHVSLFNLNLKGTFCDILGFYD